MTGLGMAYAAITPARNEADNLRRLAKSLASQTVPPAVWIIVDNGSADDTAAVAAELSQQHEWAHAADALEPGSPVRGGPIVRAFHAGLALLEEPVDVVVKLDADISIEPDYFERLLDRFAGDPLLGIASGSGHELENGRWVQRHTTGTSVWGAARAYRWACLHDVLPLEERMGWDGIDEFKATSRGWRTTTIVELPFHHHRREGQRDGSQWRAWCARGRAARYMGYRRWYLVLRALHHAWREPAAVGLLAGYAAAAARREPVLDDETVRAQLRRRQSLRSLRARRREAIGVRGS